LAHHAFFAAESRSRTAADILRWARFRRVGGAGVRPAETPRVKPCRAVIASSKRSRSDFRSASPVWCRVTRVGSFGLTYSRVTRGREYTIGSNKLFRTRRVSLSFAGCGSARPAIRRRKATSDRRWICHNKMLRRTTPGAIQLVPKNLIYQG
jgi:hypothetical protein